MPAPSQINHHGIISSMLLARGFQQQRPLSFQYSIWIWHKKFHVSSLIVWERMTEPQTIDKYSANIQPLLHISKRNDELKETARAEV
jgi:hypothetical protein